MSDARAILPNLTNEEEFILLCARTELDGSKRVRLRELAASGLDWKCIAEIARLHRLRPLLFKHLKNENLTAAPPKEIFATIQAHAVRVIARNMAMTNTLAKLLKDFHASGIEAIPFKGPILALRSYQNLGLREFVDMDFLLRRADILKAKKILLAQGYISPWKQNDEWEEQHIDAQLGCDFTSSDGAVRLELHWSFIQKWLSYEVDLDSIWSRAESFEVAGMPLRIVARDDLLVYLCAHGAKHHWERLFWIVDIAEIALSAKNLAWEKLVANARAHGNWLVLALGLQLARNLLQAPIPTEIAAQIDADARVARLAANVGTWLFREEKRLVSGAWPETKFYLGVKERWSDRANYSIHQTRLALAPSDKDHAFIKLPKSLSFLYPAVRPIRWLLQRGKN